MKKISKSMVYLILCIIAFVASGIAGDSGYNSTQNAFGLVAVVLLIASIVNSGD